MIKNATSIWGLSMSIGIIGGTFNPIHFGHLRIAEEIRETLNLNKVLFIPAFQPPHKDNKLGSLVEPEHRLKMTNIAIKSNPFFEVSDMEIARGGQSYSVVTLRTLHETLPPLNPPLTKGGCGGVDIYFIIGTDSFNDITTWCDYEEIFKLANLVVVSRPGYPVKKIGEVLPVELARGFWYDAEKNIYSNNYGKSVIYIETTQIGISASGIRKSIKTGESIKYLLPVEVEDYIRKNKLYLKEVI